ncbi:putative carboxylesterase [Cardamine amara subsp. amara]|uniref:Carboxylesterase n=1 Tax=Cardamine amara subsp. amara TaxID=228776 RepID=A0ABD1ABH8_CARAN
MSKQSPISDPYAYLSIVKNPDGSITRDKSKFPCVAATPDPSPLNPVFSFLPPLSRESFTGGVRRRMDQISRQLSNVYLMGTSAGGNLAYNVGIRSADSVADLSPLQIPERCESEIRLVNDQVCPPIVSDVFWDLCLPVGVDRDHEYSNPTVGGGSEKLEKIGRLRWKVMVTGGEKDPMIDRQREVAKLMKKKGVEVVEQFNDGDVHGAEFLVPSKQAQELMMLEKIII